ncbi:hypothetical protein M153_3560002125 [Pseudoloma neurophilia]|uniref:Ricin B lectin protein n=1 Tax=Pseudoloma neurophilia TaxID=146866 RepID=A0A0R0LXX6_9MICR|nr:hypothetical protein M153_3560002125 [Pseudoloma neurophilia]
MFFLLIFCNMITCRVFRLMEADSKKFVSAPKKYANLDTQCKSALFEDEAVKKKEKTIRIKITDDSNRYLDYDVGMGRLGSMPKKNVVNQYFTVKMLSRDLAVIKYQSNSNCLTYVAETNIFSLKTCDSKYNKQKFIVTDKNGSHHFSDDESQKQLDWGNCPDCVPGGFGSEKEGESPVETGDLSQQSSSDDEKDEKDNKFDKKAPLPVGLSSKKGVSLFGSILDKIEDMKKADDDSESSSDTMQDLLASDANPSTFPVLEVQHNNETLSRVKFPNMQLEGMRDKKIPFALHVYKKVSEV